MTGPCACEIKMMNPGVDLLMNTDWDARLSESPRLLEQELPPVELSGFEKFKRKSDTRPTDDGTHSDEQSSDVFFFPTIRITIAVILLIVVVATLAIYRRKE